MTKESTKQIHYNRTYKDVLFDMIFSDKKAILELYNAIAQTDYKDESAVSVNTIKRAVFLGIENDKSFIIDDILNIYEHQSTVEECIEHGILKDILLKEKGVIEDMITVCYDEEIHKMREAEYNQELGEERGKEIGKEIGKQLGVQQSKQQIAKRMHLAGMSLEQIMDITELSKEDLEKLFSSESL